VGGFLQLTKSIAVASGQSCAGSPSFSGSGATSNPGDCLKYTLTYANVSPSGGTNCVSLIAHSVVITENGNASGNTWAANTNGLYATPVDTGGGTLGGSPTVGATVFTDTISTLAAGASGTLTFLVQVK
jgi:hypothetical protein